MLVARLDPDVTSPPPISSWETYSSEYHQPVVNADIFHNFGARIDACPQDGQGNTGLYPREYQNAWASVHARRQLGCRHVRSKRVCLQGGPRLSEQAKGSKHRAVCRMGRHGLMIIISDVTLWLGGPSKEYGISTTEPLKVFECLCTCAVWDSEPAVNNANT